MTISPINAFNFSKVKQNSNSSKNVSFSGSSKILQNKVYPDGQREIKAILAEKPDRSLVVGQLPQAVFEKIPAESRKEAIPAILKALDLAAKSIREFDGPVLTAENYFTFSDSDRERPQIANDILTDAFRKYGVISGDEQINLKYFGKGISSKAFLVEGIRDDKNDDDFLLKVYHKVESSNWHDAKTRGVHAELNNAMYWRAQAGQNTQKGKFYCGSMESGYMLTNLLDEDSRFPNKNVSPYHYGLNYDRNRPATVALDTETSNVKGYNYSHSFMPVVNRIKNESKYARNFLAKLDNMDQASREALWTKTYKSAAAENNETKLQALALGIKYMKNKSELVDNMLEFESPKVNQALAYLLKYMTKNEALKYFDKLAETKDPLTQVILFNEIPLLGKRFVQNAEIVDDIHVSLMEIIPEKILQFYEIAEKHAIPETIEHLASSVYMLPITKLEDHYTKLASIDNDALKERLGWKVRFLPIDFQNTAKELISK